MGDVVDITTLRAVLGELVFFVLISLYIEGLNLFKFLMRKHETGMFTL